MSGALISACVQPLDVLRTRMQGDAAQGASRTTLATLHLVVKQYGIRCISPRAGHLSMVVCKLLCLFGVASACQTVSVREGSEAVWRQV